MTEPNGAGKTYLRILFLLQEEGEAFSVSEITDSLGISESTVRSVLKVQERVERVEKLGVASSGGRCYGITRVGREHLAACALGVSTEGAR